MLTEQLVNLQDQEMLIWIHENIDLFQEFHDELVLESIMIEQFDNLYGFLLEDICEDYRREHVLREDLERINKSVINESWASLAADIGIGLGSMIPGIGTGVAAGGVIYYLYKAYDNLSKNRQFESFMDLLSAAFTAPQVVPGLGTAAGAAGKAVVKGLQKILGPIFKLFSKAKNSIGSFYQAGKATAQGSKFATKITEIMTKNSDKLGKLNPVLETAAKYANKLKDFIKGKKDALKPVFDRLGFSADDAVKTIEKGTGAIDDAAKMTKSAAAGKIDDAVESTLDIGAKINVFGPDDAAKLKELQKARKGLMQSKRTAALTKSGLGKAETEAMKHFKELDKLNDLGKSSDEIYALQKAARKGTQEAYKNLSKQVKGLEKEFLKAKGYPKGTKMVPRDSSTYKIILPDGKVKTMVINQSKSGTASTATDFARFVKTSQAYKNYQKGLSKGISKLNAEIAELMAKKKGAGAISAKAVEKVTEKALQDPKVQEKVFAGFLDGLSDKAFEKIGQATLGVLATMTSTIETASTEERDDRRKYLEDEFGADFGDSDYTMGAF